MDITPDNYIVAVAIPYGVLLLTIIVMIIVAKVTR